MVLEQGAMVLRNAGTEIGYGARVGYYRPGDLVLRNACTEIRYGARVGYYRPGAWCYTLGMVLGYGDRVWRSAMELG
eukprot:2927091-Rhodomonas_salina.2